MAECNSQASGRTSKIWNVCHRGQQCAEVTPIQTQPETESLTRAHLDTPHVSKKPPPPLLPRAPFLAFSSQLSSWHPVPMPPSRALPSWPGALLCPPLENATALQTPFCFIPRASSRPPQPSPGETWGPRSGASVSRTTHRARGPQSVHVGALSGPGARGGVCMK